MGDRPTQGLKRERDPGFVNETVARVCATFLWDNDECCYIRIGGCDNNHSHLKKTHLECVRLEPRQQLYLRMSGREEHENLKELESLVEHAFSQDICSGLYVLKEFQQKQCMSYEGFFDTDIQAIHLSLSLFRAICDDDSPAHSRYRNANLIRLCEFILPNEESDVNLLSDCDADISAFLDSVKPPLVPEHGPVEGLLCQLLPFQARALTWALNRERAPESPPKKLHGFFEELEYAGRSLYINRYIGRMTTVRFDDKAETIRGGMLCQTMGLGKTVEQIAIILSNPAPENWLHEGEFERRAATLVVCPQALLGQWQQEVAHHAPQLRIGIVFTQNDFHILDDFELDIVLTSYEIIRQQSVYQTANENRRTSRRGRSSIHPVPFLQTEWWRVVLDEAQRITGDSGVTKAAQKLKANIRWVVSGTPICRRLQDLSGLLRFLGHHLGDRFYFEHLGLGNERRLRDVLSTLMYRHGKQCVESELSIPPLTVETVYVQLSDIEHIKYSKLIRKCNAIKNISGMKEQTRTARLCRMLLLLRKICCCPFLVSGKKGDTVQASEALPILEIKKRLCREAELEVDVASRVVVKSLTQLATAVAIISKDYERAEKCLKSALSVTDEAVQPFLTNEGDQDFRSGTRFDRVKTLSGRSIILECLGRVEDARNMLLDCFSTVDQHLLLQLSKLQETRPSISEDRDLSEMSLEDAFSNCSSRFTLAMFKLMMGKEAPESISELQALNAFVAKYLTTFDDEIATAVGETPQVLACLRGRLEMELRVSFHRRTLFRDLIALRMSVLECLIDLLTLSVIEDGSSFVADKNACKQLLDSLPVDRDRVEVGFFAEDNSDEDDAPEEENFLRTSLGENRTGFNLDSETVDYLVLQGSIITGLLRTAEKLHCDVDESTLKSLTSRVSLISIVVGKEPAAISSRCSSWIAAMFAVLRSWLYLRQMITNSDENDRIAGQCWERCFVIREELRNIYRRSFDQLESFFEEIRAGKEDVIGASLDVRRAEIDLRKSEQELHSRQNEHRYISQKFSEDVLPDESRIHSDNDVCPICRGQLQTPIVTPCGHVFCSSCLASYMVSGHGLCPLRCRNRFQFKDCLLIDESAPEQQSKNLQGEPSVNEVQSDYGAKITDLLKRLFIIRRDDPTAKSLVFSQWNDLLDVCKMALEEHGIKCVQLKGDCRQKAKCIDQFLNSATMTVFLIPMAQGASGLTMVAARHAFIMEPGLNPSLEDQAINRIHRIGQHYTTKVIKYIAKGTVEEPIAEIQERQRATGQQAQKAYTPEVFDESILNDIFR